MGRRQALLVFMMMVVVVVVAAEQNYGDALSKSILFFEGQRSGKLPPTQRLRWRSHSALRDGFDRGADLVGGYYDAGDNVKYNFLMAFTTTMLAWSVIDFGGYMGDDLKHALEAIRWATDYLLKSSSRNDTIFVGVGNPWEDHNCSERPEDMDTPRTSVSIDQQHPGSEVSAEMAAALAASSIAFRHHDRKYARKLLKRATSLFRFADKFQGSYSNSVGHFVCPFYCDFNGYQDELIWAAEWLYKATKSNRYGSYVKGNIGKLADAPVVRNFGGKAVGYGGSFTEFGWDAKHAGIAELFSQLVMKNPTESYPFVPLADGFICSVLPESLTKAVTYSPGGLLFKPGGSNLQHPTALGFLLLAYARSLHANNRVVECGNIVATPARLITVVKGQADYILGQNPLGMSYMVGYGDKYPQMIHHRGSVLPSVFQHPQALGCRGGDAYFSSANPNLNTLIGAIVGGPYENDAYNDTRFDFAHSEPTTYINAPLVGMLAYFKAFPKI